MAYFDPASNPGPKPERFGVKNWKSLPLDELLRLETIFGIFCKLLIKNSIYFLFYFHGGTFARQNTEPFEKIKTRIYHLRENVLHGFIHPDNLSSALPRWNIKLSNRD